jgi:hypothetical protein
MKLLFIVMLSFAAYGLSAQSATKALQRTAMDKEYDQFVNSLLTHYNAKKNGHQAHKATFIPQRIVAQSYSIISEHDSTYYGYTDPDYSSEYNYGNIDVKLSYTQTLPNYFNLFIPILFEPQFYFKTESDAIADTIHYIEPQGYWNIKALSYYNANQIIDSFINIQNTVTSPATNYVKCLIFRNSGKIDSLSHSISLDGLNYETILRRYFRYNTSGQILLDSVSNMSNIQIFHRHKYHYNNSGNIDTIAFWENQDTIPNRIYSIGYNLQGKIDTINTYTSYPNNYPTENRYAFKYTAGIDYATYIEESKLEFPVAGPPEYWYWNKIYKYPRPDGKIDSVVYYRALSGGFVRNQASHYTYNTLGNPQFITHYTPTNYFTSDTLLGKSIFYYDNTNDVDTGTSTGIHVPDTKFFPGLSIYPNPFSDFFQLSTQDENQVVHIALYDMSGVRKLFADGKIVSINLQLASGLKKLPPGNYLLLIRNSKGNEQEFKIIKNK